MGREDIPKRGWIYKGARDQVRRWEGWFDRIRPTFSRECAFSIIVKLWKSEMRVFDARFWRLSDGHRHEQSRTITCPLPTTQAGRILKVSETPSGAAFGGIRRHEDDYVDESRDCLSWCFEIRLLFHTVRVWKPVRLIAWGTWTTTCG